MNTTKLKQSTNQKLKSISLRLTEEELNQLNKQAKCNHQNRTTYILNKCLPEVSNNIYSTQFINTVNRLANLVNNMKSDVPAVKEEIISLRKEVEKLWLSLK